VRRLLQSENNDVSVATGRRAAAAAAPEFLNRANGGVEGSSGQGNEHILTFNVE